MSDEARGLAERLARGDDPLEVRVELAEKLSELGDPRLEGETFVEIPEGPFLLGTSEDSEGEHKPHESPQVTLDLPAFEIARFPVTVAEYRRFIDDGGYRRKELWRDLGWTWREENRIELPRFFSEDERAEWHPYLTANRPVVGASFYEAEAFARWANARLPTEAEWEKAARGAYGNEWPWGNEFDPNKCNSAEGKKGGTTPVGAYSALGGDSPYGCADMVGNVWEWCADWFNEAEYKPRASASVVDPRGPQDGKYRVLRGGSFSSNRNVARCAYRDRNNLTLRNLNYGFRVCASPSQDILPSSPKFRSLEFGGGG